jgi:hypothetical protein
VVGAELQITVRSEEEEPGVDGEVDDVAEEVERGAVGPVEVVEDDDERPSLGKAEEEADDGVVETDALLVRSEGDQCREVGDEGTELRNDLGKRRGSLRSGQAEGVVDMLWRGAADETADRFDPRCERRRPVAFVAAAPEDESAALLGVIDEGASEACLADAGFTGDQGDAAGAERRLLETGGEGS